MRIISGIYKGQTISAPSGHKTHPMSEKMRGAIFNSLGDIDGLSFLDVYSGSGAVALEAKSRGATEVVAIDSDKKAIATIKENALALGAEIKITQANISSWLDNNPQKKFFIVVADPPYDKVNQTHLSKLLKAILPSGIFVVSLPSAYNLPVDEGYFVLSIKKYGDSSLVFMRKLG